MRGTLARRWVDRDGTLSDRARTCNPGGRPVVALSRQARARPLARRYRHRARERDGLCPAGDLLVAELAAEPGVVDRQPMMACRGTVNDRGGPSSDGGLGLLAVLLDAGGAQAGEAMLVDRILPGEEFLDRQRIAAAGLLERKEPAAHGSNDLGLAPDDPALGPWCRQIGDGQRAAVRPDDVFGPRSQGLGHQ